MRIHGLAVPWGRAMTVPRDGWRPAFLCGAFTSSVGALDVRLLVNHEPAAVVATHVRLFQADDGLYFSATAMHPWAALIRSAGVNGCSVCWDRSTEIFDRLHWAHVRLIRHARLLEVSVVVGREAAFSGTWARLTAG